MLKLPQSCFNHVLTFCTAEEIFSSMGVSKSWEERTHDKNMWKQKLKIEHPAALDMAQDAESFFQDIERYNNNFHQLEVGDLQFIFEVFKNPTWKQAKKQKLDIFSWTGDPTEKRFPRKSWVDDAYDNVSNIFGILYVRTMRRPPRYRMIRLSLDLQESASEIGFLEEYIANNFKLTLRLLEQHVSLMMIIWDHFGNEFEVDLDESGFMHKFLKTFELL